MITVETNYKSGRLTARPITRNKKERVSPGIQPINFGGRRHGFIYIPKSYDEKRPAPLAVMLHGAGGKAEHGLSLLKNYADHENIILIAPPSYSSTWDIIAVEAFGNDVVFIDSVLKITFESYNIDPSKIAVGGFSDGASYALCLGLTNGDLFTHILAFSPGFVYTIEKNGKPKAFISHGIKDQVLSITSCSRRIVPQLQSQGISVNYLEFKGEHQVPSSISAKGIEWFMENDI